MKTKLSLWVAVIVFQVVPLHISGQPSFDYASAFVGGERSYTHSLIRAIDDTSALVYIMMRWRARAISDDWGLRRGKQILPVDVQMSVVIQDLTTNKRKCHEESVFFNNGYGLCRNPWCAGHNLSL